MAMLIRSLYLDRRRNREERKGEKYNIASLQQGKAVWGQEGILFQISVKSSWGWSIKKSI